MAVATTSPAPAPWGGGCQLPSPGARPQGISLTSPAAFPAHGSLLVLPQGPPHTSRTPSLLRAPSPRASPCSPPPRTEDPLSQAISPLTPVPTAPRIPSSPGVSPCPGCPLRLHPQARRAAYHPANATTVRRAYPVGEVLHDKPRHGGDRKRAATKKTPKQQPSLHSARPRRAQPRPRQPVGAAIFPPGHVGERAQRAGARGGARRLATGS